MSNDISVWIGDSIKWGAAAGETSDVLLSKPWSGFSESVNVENGMTLPSCSGGTVRFSAVDFAPVLSGLEGEEIAIYDYDSVGEVHTLLFKGTISKITADATDGEIQIESILPQFEYDISRPNADGKYIPVCIGDFDHAAWVSTETPHTNVGPSGADFLVTEVEFSGQIETSGISDNVHLVPASDIGIGPFDCYSQLVAADPTHLFISKGAGEGTYLRLTGSSGEGLAVVGNSIVAFLKDRIKTTPDGTAIIDSCDISGGYFNPNALGSIVQFVRLNASFQQLENSDTSTEASVISEGAYYPVPGLNITKDGGDITVSASFFEGKIGADEVVDAVAWGTLDATSYPGWDLSPYTKYGDCAFYNSDGDGSLDSVTNGITNDILSRDLNTYGEVVFEVTHDSFYTSQMVAAFSVTPPPGVKVNGLCIKAEVIRSVELASENTQLAIGSYGENTLWGIKSGSALNSFSVDGSSNDKTLRFASYPDFAFDTNTGNGPYNQCNTNVEVVSGRDNFEISYEDGTGVSEKINLFFFSTQDWEWSAHAFTTFRIYYVGFFVTKEQVEIGNTVYSKSTGIVSPHTDLHCENWDDAISAIVPEALNDHDGSDYAGTGATQHPKTQLIGQSEQVGKTALTKLMGEAWLIPSIASGKLTVNPLSGLYAESSFDYDLSLPAQGKLIGSKSFDDRYCFSGATIRYGYDAGLEKYAGTIVIGGMDGTYTAGTSVTGITSATAAEDYWYRCKTIADHTGAKKPLPEEKGNLKWAQTEAHALEYLDLMLSVNGCRFAGQYERPFLTEIELPYTVGKGAAIGDTIRIVCAAVNGGIQAGIITGVSFNPEQYTYKITAATQTVYGELWDDPSATDELYDDPSAATELYDK